MHLYIIRVPVYYLYTSLQHVSTFKGSSSGRIFDTFLQHVQENESTVVKLTSMQECNNILPEDDPLKVETCWSDV